MALEFQLEIVTSQKADEVLSLLESVGGMQRRPNPGKRDFLQGNGLSSVDVYSKKSLGFGTDLVNEAFGFSPTMWVGFRFDNLEPSGGNRPWETMMTMVQQLLTGLEGDCILLFNGESVMLLRRGGKLSLNSNWQWTENELKYLKLPYLIESLKEVL